jgi:hypothetical protein
MTITFNGAFFGKALAKPEAKSRKSKEKADVSVIANRDFKEVPFIAGVIAQFEDEQFDEKTLLKKALLASPERTILAMFESGMSTKQVAGKLGMQADSDTFKRIVSTAKAFLKRELTANWLAKIPDRVEVPVVYEDGSTETVDIADKLSKAISAAFFNGKSNEVRVSVKKGLPLTNNLEAIFGTSADEIRAEKTRLSAKLGSVFRTRDTSEKTLSPMDFASFLDLSDDDDESDD